MEKMVFEHKIMDFSKFSRVMENTDIRFEENNFDLKDFIKTLGEMSEPGQIDTPDTASESGSDRKLDNVIIDNLDNVQKNEGTGNDNANVGGSSAPKSESQPAQPAEPKKDEPKDDKAQNAQDSDDKKGEKEEKPQPEDDKKD